MEEFCKNVYVRAFDKGLLIVWDYEESHSSSSPLEKEPSHPAQDDANEGRDDDHNDSVTSGDSDECFKCIGVTVNS